MPTVNQVKEALEDWLGSHQTRIEYLTFSGNGEPCLHPQFDEMVDLVREARGKFVPQAKVAILSNSTCLDVPKVRSGLDRIELKIMKLDCGTDETFRRINRPCPGVDLEEVVENLGGLKDFVLQSVLVDGSTSNTGPDELNRWARRIGQIRPREVQIYSIDRPSADQGLALVGKDRLNQIAARAQKESGISVKVF
jgi:wyosine [tRNA(Phe)-imidazoG37] synthetase (radical SAM superfamily)